MPLDSIGTPGLWTGFFALVLAMLALDLGVFHRKAHAVGLEEAARWTAIWIALAAVFGMGIHFGFGPDRALEFATGYLIEKALAVDNIFVFVVVFAAFGIPAQLQHRVLFWGILGALVLRGLFVMLGAALFARFHFLLYLFGALLLWTGIKLLRTPDEAPDPRANPLVRAFERLVPVTDSLHGEIFLVRLGGKIHATPLLLALAAIEATDVVFALDSIPAIFAVTTDPFIVFTSNIFAILGLRSMYFLLAGVIDRLCYLRAGLAFILAFVGGKMLMVDLIKVPAPVSLAVIATILTIAALASIWSERQGLDPVAPQPDTATI